MTLIRNAIAYNRFSLALYRRMTLAWCNLQRRGQGKQPLIAMPVGDWADANSCPVAVATGHPSYWRASPWFVQRFIEAFDRSLYPDLIRARVNPVEPKVLGELAYIPEDIFTPDAAEVEAMRRAEFIRDYDERRAEQVGV